jgi:ribosome-associated heat shock protein Hsp15
MTNDKTPRIDKFLWSVRLFKTRSLAVDACRKGRITIGEIPVKPSRPVNAGEIIQVIKPPVNYSYKIIALPANRISAKLVPDYIEDLTSREELSKLENKDTFFIKRDRGTGRPTKKERRLIDKLKET